MVVFVAPDGVWAHSVPSLGLLRAALLSGGFPLQVLPFSFVWVATSLVPSLVSFRVATSLAGDPLPRSLADPLFLVSVIMAASLVLREWRPGALLPGCWCLAAERCWTPADCRYCLR